MRGPRLSSLLAAGLLAALAGPGAWAAETAFALRNSDPEALFVYWTVDAAGAVPGAPVLPGLALAPGGSHGVAPGERVRVVLAEGRSLVGVFVPWAGPLSYRSPLAGGFLLPGEVPSRGTVLVDRPSFAAANRGRALEAPLQAWGLEIPRFALDGRTADWQDVVPAAEWGTSFRPGAAPGTELWPEAWPRVKTLQAADADGALWVRLAADRPWVFPAGVSVSLLLRRPGTLVEWPLTGADGTVRSWADGAEGQAVGQRALAGPDLEARVPWDRLGDRKAWTAARSVWSLAVTQGEKTRVLDLVPGALEELP